MRTTVTLTPDAEAAVRRRMARRQVSFKDALNSLIRDAEARGPERPAFRTRTASLGASSVPLDRALQLAADLEDDELIRRLQAGS